MIASLPLCLEVLKEGREQGNGTERAPSGRESLEGSCRVDSERCSRLVARPDAWPEWEILGSFGQGVGSNCSPSLANSGWPTVAVVLAVTSLSLA